MGKKCKIGTFIGVLFCLGVVGLVTYLAITFGSRGKKIRYEVTKAAFTQFDLSNDNTVLNYNIAITAAAINPNKKCSVHLEKIIASPVFINQKLFYSPFEPLDLGPGKRADFVLSRKGAVSIPDIPVDQVALFRSNARVFDIHLLIEVPNGWMKFKGKKVEYKHAVYCHLQVPLILDGKYRGFNTTMCKQEMK